MNKKRKLTPQEKIELNFKRQVGLRSLQSHDDTIDRLVMWREHTLGEVKLAIEMLESGEYDPATYEHVIWYKSPPIIKECPRVEYEIERLSNPSDE